MASQAFEEDKEFVTRELRRGNFDYLEIVGAVEETKFFKMLLGEGVLEALAKGYPSPREKEDVPLWLYLASDITLRLHGAQGFGAYPYILHSGGLLAALGPDQREYRCDPKTGQLRLTVLGYNQKNRRTRVTPCDKDYLRKMSKDTRPEPLQYWFGTDVVRVYHRLDAFEAEGIFAIDGTYIFVPLENKHYEESSVLRFDGRGHPISQKQYDALSKKEQERCVWRRCYRAVTLSHITREKDYTLRCGTTVHPGKAAETPHVWPMVQRFVEAVGQGVMKLLIYDRGLIDGKTVTRLKGVGVDSLFPLKKGMDLWEDAKVLAREHGEPWRRYDIPKPVPPRPPKDRPEADARREAKRQRTLQNRRKKVEPGAPARTLEWIEYKYIAPSRVWESCEVPVGVLLIKNHYANGEVLEWALASTKEFENPLDMWFLYGLRSEVEEDHRQEKCAWDMTNFRTPAFSHVVNRILFVELAHSLIQIFLRKTEQRKLLGKSRQRILDSLLSNGSKIVLYYQQRFGMFEPYEYQELLLTLPEGARRRALGKTRRLRRSQLTAPELPWRSE